jgi:hypothetical protein
MPTPIKNTGQQGCNILSFSAEIHGLRILEIDDIKRNSFKPFLRSL